MFLDEYPNIPYKVLEYTAGHINYGGRVTDDWDRRCMMTILQDYYNPKVLEDGHTFSKSGIYKQLNPELEYAVSCFPKVLKFTNPVSRILEVADSLENRVTTLDFLRILYACPKNPGCTETKKQKEMLS